MNAGNAYNVQHLFGIQAQRAGKKPPDGDATFASVWRWKQPAFETLCPTYVQGLSTEQAADLHLDHYTGYFQFGGACYINVGKICCNVSAKEQQGVKYVHKASLWHHKPHEAIV